MILYSIFGSSLSTIIFKSECLLEKKNILIIAMIFSFFLERIKETISQFQNLTDANNKLQQVVFLCVILGVIVSLMIYCICKNLSNFCKHSFMKPQNISPGSIKMKVFSTFSLLFFVHLQNFQDVCLSLRWDQ